MAEYHSRMERRRALEREKQQTKTNRRATGNGTSGGGKKRSWFKRLIIVFLLGLLFLILAGSITVLAIIKNAPALNTDNLRDPISSVIYDKDGKKATEVYTGENRMYTSIDDIPELVQNAFLATEDVRFYKHFGVDPIRIGGAGVAQFTEGFKSEGASTITQQVVRMSFLTQDKTFTRKIQEAYLAIQLEKKYSKKQILEMYLNKIYLGDGPTYGVAAAAQKYFGKDLKEIRPEEAAMLAAMTRNPGYYDPINHPEEAKERRDLVLDLMVDNHVISSEDASQAKKVSIKEMTKNHKDIKQGHRKYDAFLDYVREVLVNKEKLVTEQEFAAGGLKIYTTLDPKIQQQTEKVLNDKDFYPEAKDNFEAGVSILDTQSGAIRALGGGPDYKYGENNWSLINDGNNVGSAAKPIMDYGPAIEYLNWPTNYTVQDVPTKYSGSDGKSIGNWDGRYLGSMSMRRALYLSRNVPAVRTLQNFTGTDEGQNQIKSFIGKLGFTKEAYGNNDKDPFDYINESYGIGAFSSSPLIMSGAYAAFGNNGIYNEPFAVTKVVFPDGYEVQLEHDRHVAMNDSTAYMITDMLKDVVSNPEGTGYGFARIPGAPLAGKTGTQNISDEMAKEFNISPDEQDHGATDAWFVGYTSRLTAAVWSGYEHLKDEKIDNKAYYLGSSEQKYSQQLFKAIMSDFMSGNPDFERPASVIDIGGGELAVKGSNVADKYSEQQQEAAKKAMEEARKKAEEEKKKKDSSSSSSSNTESSSSKSEQPQNPGSGSSGSDVEGPSTTSPPPSDSTSDTGGSSLVSPSGKPSSTSGQSP